MVESIDAPIRVPQHILEIVDGEVVICTPDPRPQPLPCRMMSSDAPRGTSNGPSRDKSADIKTNGGSVSAGRGGRMQYSGSGNNGGAEEDQNPHPLKSCHLRGGYPLTPDPLARHSPSPQAGLESPVKMLVSSTTHPETSRTSERHP